VVAITSTGPTAWELVHTRLSISCDGMTASTPWGRNDAHSASSAWSSSRRFSGVAAVVLKVAAKRRNSGASTSLSGMAISASRLALPRNASFSSLVRPGRCARRIMQPPYTPADMTRRA
jgi:hypothetical protein